MKALTRAGAGAMVDELAAKLGVSHSAVRARASRLGDRGLVQGDRAHGFVFYKLTPAGVAVNRGR